MMANSAVSDRVKRSTMTNEAIQRLFCCSDNLDPSTRVRIMEDFAKMLKRSGYSERFRHEVISDALRGFEKKRQEEAAGGQPIDRPREYHQEDITKRRKGEGGSIHAKSGGLLGYIPAIFFGFSAKF